MPSDFFDLSFDSEPGFAPDSVVSALGALDELDISQALDLVGTVKDAQGETPLVQHLLALCMLRLGRPAPAVRMLRQAHEADPNAYEFVEVLAASTALLGQQAESVYFAKLATALKPAYPEYRLVPVWLIRFTAALMMAEENPLVDDAVAAMADGDYDRAMDSLTDALSLDGEDKRAWRTLVQVSMLRKRPGDALKAAEALSALSPDDAEALQLRTRASQACGLIDAAWADAQDAVAASQGDPNVVQTMISLARYGNEVGLAQLYPSLVEAWRTLVAIKPEPVPVTLRKAANEPFRVGILTGQIFSGTEKAGFLSTLDECLRRGAELYYYVNQEAEDSVSRRLRRGSTRWRVIARVDDHTAAEIIRNDEVQILIDLDGFDVTGRPGVVALAPAPVLLDLGAPVGASAYTAHSSNAIAWSLVDESMMGTTDPGAEGVAVVSASLSTWPLFLPMDAADEVDAAGDGPLNILIDAPMANVSSPMLSCLAATLAANPATRIVWRGDAPEDSVAVELFEERARTVGLDPRAVHRVGPDRDIVALVRACDVLLDSFPVPSLEPVFQALRHSRPVLCVQPALPMNGATASMIQGLGLRDWIAADADALKQRLVSLAEDPGSARAARKAIAAAVETGSSIDVRTDRAKALLSLIDHLLGKVAAS